MGRPPCCDKSNVKRGLWTAEEDAKILAYVANHGTGNWTSVPKKAGLKRCGKSCRLRYTNYLRPDIKRESFTPQEEDIIISLHATIGSRWSVIAQRLPGRTDNDVKNHWNTKLKKKLFNNGIDPITHRPIAHILQSLGGLPPALWPPSSAAPCLNRDLKSILTSGRPDLFSVLAPPPTYDLLTQLHAIQLVTAGCSSSSSAASTHVYPPPPDPVEPKEELSWSDFLVDDVVLCMREAGDGDGQAAAAEEEKVPAAGDALDGCAEEESGTEWEFPELTVEESFDLGDGFDFKNKGGACTVRVLE